MDKPNIYQLEQTILEELDMKQGIIASRQLHFNFNVLYDLKHRNKKEYSCQEVQDYNAKRVYTLCRFLSINYGIGR